MSSTHEAREILRHTSTLCLRNLHDQCVAAICECSCHGVAPAGGTPKNKPLDLERFDRRTKQPMPDTATKPAPPNGQTPPHRCQDCGRVFDTFHALRVHRARTHGDKKQPASSAATPKPSPLIQQAARRVDEGRRVLVVIDENPLAVVLSTATDADHVADMLDKLGHASRVFPLHD